MAKQVQLRRGTTAELSSVTGAIGEVIVDTTKDTLTVHDGYTAGGVPLLKEDLGNLANNSVGLGKIATGTHGQILYYNASGQLTTLAPGTSGYVLKTNGAGQNPSWGEGLPTQTSNAGKTLTTNGTSASWTYSKVLKVSHFVNSTNTSLNDSSSGTIWSVNITKDYGSADTDLVVFGALIGRGSYSDYCGVYAHISGSTSTGTDGSAYYDIGYNGESASRPCIIRIQGKRFESLGAATHTLTIGWSTRNGSAGDKPFPIWNPNSGNDARSHQQRSNLVVYEVAR